jgi:flagellar assembly protein FliH
VARKIFKAAEVKEIKSKVLITPPQIGPRKKEEAVPAEEIEELEEPEAEVVVEEVQPVKPVQEERELLLADAKKIKEEAEAEAKRIRGEAEEAAFKIMQKSNVDVRKSKEEVDTEAQRIVEEARATATRLEEEAKKKADEIIAEARRSAMDEGRDEGFKKGEEEAQRLIEQLHEILNAAIDERKKILDRTEQQVIDLVLLIARKVIKVISESEKSVVIENVKEALKKVQGETAITIKVNTRDMELTSKHKKEFIAAVESLKQVAIEEDSRIDPGGCIISTSFGDIDGRIQNQLHIIEESIRELVPITE